MNDQEYQQAVAQRDELNEKNAQLQSRMQDRINEIAELQARIEARTTERNRVLAEYDGELRSLHEDLKSLNNLQAADADERKDVKRQYGRLFEECGMYERAQKRNATTAAE